MSMTLKVSKGDVIINAATGRAVLVSDGVKIRQDITEFFSVNVQPNGFGSGIEQLIGVVEISPDMFTSLADRQVRDGIQVFRSLQNREATIPRPAEERIVGLTFLQVEKDTTDPTKFVFRANIVTEKGTEVPILKPIAV